MFFKKSIFESGLFFLAVMAIAFIAFEAIGSEDEEGTYLGEYGGSEYAVDSTNNEYGQYGSEYAVDSINNDYGRYGSEYYVDSPRNPYSTGSYKIYTE